jgi:hypothetical protein
VESKKAELRDSIRRELTRLNPQVEAKVVLLTNNERSGGADITNPPDRFFDPPWRTRLSRDELWELLSGTRPWGDVDWDEARGGRGLYYNRLLERILWTPEQTFAREDVPRLQALLDKPPEELWWSGRAALLLAISRLLPPAQGELNDVNTRDGYLRKGIREEKDVFVRGELMRELIRTRLEPNRPFVIDTFFGEQKATGIPDVRGSILEELGRPPLCAGKRSLLWTLITDPRGRRLLTQPSLRMGDDFYRQKAAAAINSNAGQEVVTLNDLQELRDQGKSQLVLDRILESVKKLDAFRAPPEAAKP